MPVFVKVTRRTQKIRAVIYGAAVIALSIAAFLCWRQPEAREVALPLVLFFDAVYGYRLYLSVRLLRQYNLRS